MNLDFSKISKRSEYASKTYFPLLSRFSIQSQGSKLVDDMTRYVIVKKWPNCPFFCFCTLSTVECNILCPIQWNFLPSRNGPNFWNCSPSICHFTNLAGLRLTLLHKTCHPVAGWSFKPMEVQWISFEKGLKVKFNNVIMNNVV